MATVTANGKYKYDCVFMNISLDEWVQLVHKNNAKLNCWKYSPLKKGCFGYDNLAISIGHVFTEYPEMKTHSKEETDILDVLAEAIHVGWTENYLYWRDNKPWLNDKNYTKPAQSLGDSRRNLCAETDYNHLPEDERNKDIIIASFIYDSLN